MSHLNFYYSHLNSAAQVIQSYDGSIPFPYFIKAYFSQNKKFGSKDRKQITRLCFAFFRLGNSFPELPIKERILTGLRNTHEPIEPLWLKIMEEYELPSEKPKNIFPWKEHLTETIDATTFEASFTNQPDLFLRIRPGHEKTVFQKLDSSNISYVVEGNSIRLPNAAKVNEILSVNKEVVVQDLSSQKIAAFLEHIKNSLPAGQKIAVYDCCAASGGKSILANDVLKNINLTVSDIRSSILANLQKRFQQAGITGYHAFIADVSKPNFNICRKFDLVIADVPCTGSGTWARTPEQLSFFKEEKISRYVSLQKSILKNILGLVKPGGFLLYITCSVFAEENERQMGAIANENFEIQLMQTISGYDQKADTMFGCLLQRMV